MDYKEETDSYFHRYQILIDEGNPNLSALELNDTTAIATDIKIIKTDWQKVSPITFDEYKGDLGMTVLSKKNGVLDKNSSPAGVDNYVTHNKGRIRKLTPKECLRLMGFRDDFKQEVSDTQMYRQTGNSIVVDVLIALLKQMDITKFAENNGN